MKKIKSLIKNRDHKRELNTDRTEKFNGCLSISDIIMQKKTSVNLNSGHWKLVTQKNKKKKKGVIKT